MIQRRIKNRFGSGGEHIHMIQRTTTEAPIACLLEWDSSKCQIFQRKRPLFAPNLAESKSRTGLITPVLPISSRVSEVAAEPSTLPTELSVLPEALSTTATSIVGTEVTTSIEALTPALISAQKLRPKQEQPAPENGEFSTSTHKIPFIPITTKHIAPTVTTITSNFNLSHESGGSTPTIPGTSVTNRITLTPRLFQHSGNDNNANDDRFAFFWPTISLFQTQSTVTSSSRIANMHAATLAKSIYNLQSNNTKIREVVDNFIIQPAYHPDEDEMFIFSTPKQFEITISTSKPESLKPKYSSSYDAAGYQSKWAREQSKYHYSAKADYHPGSKLSYDKFTDGIYFSSTAAPYLLTTSSSVLSSAETKTVQISKEIITGEANQNYFEDLWSDIAAPPAVIVNSAHQHPATTAITPAVINRIPATTSATAAVAIFTNHLPSKPLSHKAPLLHGVATEAPLQINRNLTATTKYHPFFRKTSTESQLTVDEDEGGVELAEDRKWGVSLQPHYKPQRVLTESAFSTPRYRIRTTLASHTIYAVRPTTPMGELITSTAKAPGAPTDFPRTALISIASLSVIIIIAIVVFCVFRCRQSGPSADQYPMVCNGKQSGYAPIPAEMSPPMVHHEPTGQHGGPFFQNRVNQHNGYQQVKGAVIPNGNSLVGNGKGNGASSTNGRKKEFKEWYV